MKHILVILIFLEWSFSVFASDTTIVFKQIDYSKLFEIAKQENKAVMLYFHFDGCGACVKMEKTSFKDNKVFEYYNSNFINFEINTRKENGIEINKIYNIKMHPTFLFLDNFGNEMHRIVGVFSPEEFLSQAHIALESKKTFINFKKLYNNGNRDAEFLFDYTYILSNANELDSLVVNEYFDAIQSSDFILEKNIRYFYEFCIHNTYIFIPFNNPRFEFLLQNKDLFYAYFDKDQVISRIVFILYTSIYNAIETKDETVFNKAIEILKEYDTGEEYLLKEMDGRITGVIENKYLVLSFKLSFYEKMGDSINYYKTLDMYISKIWNDENELNNFAWGIYEKAKEEDTERIKAAIKCSVRSIELNNSYPNNDTYAWLLYKAGENKSKKEALEQANKAIIVAKRNNVDYSETQKLIDKINADK